MAAVLGALAVFAAAFFVALTLGSVGAGPDTAPAAAPSNPGHPYSQIDLPVGMVWPGLNADMLDGMNAGRSGTNYIPYADASGKVGIGTASPEGELDSRGRNFFGGLAEADNANAGIIATQPGGHLITGNNPTAAIFILAGGSDYAIYSQGGGPSTFLGNVGMGTTNPARQLHVKDVMRLEPRASAPSSPSKGDMYMDSTDNKLKVYDGTTWQPCW
jgi:hypothetical protein